MRERKAGKSHMAQQFNPNQGPAGQSNPNGQQHGNRRGNYNGGPQRQYEILVGMRLREHMRLSQLLARQMGLQESIKQLQMKRDNKVAKKLGLSLVAGASVLMGLKQVTMVERSHMYQMSRLDQEEVRIQSQLIQVEQEIIAAQQNLEDIDFEIDLLTSGINGSTPPGP
jgi:hypothetical protein